MDSNSFFVYEGISIFKKSVLSDSILWRVKSFQFKSFIFPSGNLYLKLSDNLKNLSEHMELVFENQFL